MKKVSALILFLLSFSFSNSNVNALEWAYWFVVYDGKVYEVREEESVSTNDVGEVIGKVKTQADSHTGDYYGDASNYYEIGTRYFEIKDVSVKEAIAVEKSPNEFVKALYTYDRPNIFNVNILIGLALVFFIFLLIVVLKSKQR